MPNPTPLHPTPTPQAVAPRAGCGGGGEGGLSRGQAAAASPTGCICVPAGCICVGGPVQTIKIGSRRYTFEWHPYCGPVVIHKKTYRELTQPPESDPFWNAVTWWDKQGRRMGLDGLCVWEPVPEPKPILKHLGGNHYEIIGYEPVAPPASPATEKGGHVDA